MTLPKGTVLDVYELLSLLGAGGMGEVYQARDRRLDRVVALKVIHSDMATNQESIERFQQEARAASALNHPNIITIYALGETTLAPNTSANPSITPKNIQFIATEFIEGQTLRQYIKSGRGDICELLEIFIQVANALSAAHKAGIIHRDIKPENIMVRSDGYVKVLDFGLAKLVERSSPVDVEAVTEKVHTEPGVIMGTVQYMSPEQAQGSKLDARTDIFSLGIVLYEMLSGVLPFRGSTVSHTLVAIMENPLPSLQTYAKIPETLENIVKKALTKELYARYQTVKDLVNDLKKVKQSLELNPSLLATVQLGRLQSLQQVQSQTPTILSNNENRTIKDSVEVEINISTHTTQNQDPVGEVKNGFSKNIPNQNTSSILTKNKPSKISLIILSFIIFIGLGIFGYYSYQPAVVNKNIDSIAVMPFINASNDTNLEYLSDGITENLINSFSGFPNLKVKSRNLVFAYKNKTSDTKALAKELKVRTLLLGRVLAQGDTLSIHTELIDTIDNTQIWGKIYNRKMQDISLLQEEIAENISEQLSLQLVGKPASTSNKTTRNSEAYNLHLKGLYAWNKRTPKQAKVAMEYFKQAIELDPTYALAYVGLSDSYNLLGTYGLKPPEEVFPKAKASAENALKIDPNFASAQASLGYCLANYYWKFSEAETLFQRAIKLKPDYATSYHWYGLYLLTRGKAKEAIEELKLALQQDPISLIINTNLGLAYSVAGNQDKAIEQLKTTLELEPGFALAHYRLGEIYLQKSLFNEAISEFQKATTLSEDDLRLFSALGYAYAQAGNKSEAIKVLNKLEELSKERYVSPFDFATLYVGLGKNDLAFDYLEKALQVRDNRIVWLEIDPKMSILKDMPRFNKLLIASGLKQL